MKKIIVFLFILQSASAQSVSSGVSFLKLGVGARSVAMGESFTAVSGDHASLYYNPASLQRSSRHELMLMHKSWIAGTSTEYLGATILGDRWNYGFSLHSTSVDDIEVRLIPGESEGTFSARNIAVGGSIAYGLSDRLAVGVSGKFLYEKIFVDEASGYGFDLGVLYSYDDKISFGGSILNIGSMNELRNQSSPLPTTIRLGAAYTTALTDQFHGIGSVDAVKTLDDAHTHLHTGIEIAYDHFAFFRTGYMTGYEFRSFSTGIGILFASVKFDYAFVPFSGAFNSTHTFSLSFLL
jgi:hypothetical protein